MVTQAKDQVRKKYKTNNILGRFGLGRGIVVLVNFQTVLFLLQNFFSGSVETTRAGERRRKW